MYTFREWQVTDVVICEYRPRGIRDLAQLGVTAKALDTHCAL